MIRVFLLLVTMPVAWAQSELQKLRAEYQRASAELAKHVEDQWIDDDPGTPALLEREWKLEGEFVAAWLNERPAVSVADVKAAIDQLVPSHQECDCLALNPTAFLVTGAGPIGNVYIVAKTNDRYRLAWSTAQRQQASGKTAEMLAAWRAENAHPTKGSVDPRIGRLPDDFMGRARFYIDGMYAQSAGATVGAQISVWLWDRTVARPLITREYAVMLDQAVGTRLESDLLMVQQKKQYRSFFACGGCEGRQIDWVVRIHPDRIEEAGERVVTPELDVIDELFDRIIHDKAAAELAAPEALRVAARIVRESRTISGEKNWKEYPTLGMMFWSFVERRPDEVLCFETDRSGPYLYTIKSVGSQFFIGAIRKTIDTCMSSK
jgi:hypothetical protein